MSYDISSLEPKSVWGYFDRIRQIPRPSGKESALADAILTWSKAKGALGTKDPAGNVIIKIPATPGFEHVTGIVLQGHMDMVCEKHRDKAFDFNRDPIELKRDGEWITADGTTLGADNGIGLAAALAFLDADDVPHGPLEILATVEEETGLYGAIKLDAPFIESRMLFNFDSEEDGIFYVGCAGGRDVAIELPLDRVLPPPSSKAFEVRVSGLLGGHSGLDIILNRGNAVVLLARVLRQIYEKTPFLLSSVEGGDKHNAIPREAIAHIAVPGGEDTDAWGTLVKGAKTAFLDEFGALEPDVNVSVRPIDLPDRLISAVSSTKAIDLILALPSGVTSMMRDIPNVVETSNNLARVRTEDAALALLCSSRSSVGSAIEGVADKMDAVCRLVGATGTELSRYPGWKPNMKSAMLARARGIWEAVHGAEPEVHVVHAGLECGIIGEKFDGMDMISIGPTIENPHSPSERVHIESVARFFAFAKAFVAAVANG